jgi:hypothetical protein
MASAKTFADAIEVVMDAANVQRAALLVGQRASRSARRGSMICQPTERSRRSR